MTGMTGWIVLCLVAMVSALVIFSDKTKWKIFASFFWKDVRTLFVEVSNAQVHGFYATPKSEEATNTQVNGLPVAPRSEETTNTQVNGLYAAPRREETTNTQVYGLYAAPKSEEVTNTQVNGLYAAPRIEETTNTQVYGLYAAPRIEEVAGTQVNNLYAAPKSEETTNTQVYGLYAAPKSEEPANTQVNSLYVAPRSEEPANTQINSLYVAPISEEPANTQVNSLYAAPRNEELVNTQAIDTASSRHAFMGTLKSLSDQPVHNKSKQDALILKAEDIERKMEYLAQRNDAEGLNNLSVEINNLFAEIINNKSQAELDSLLVVKAKSLMTKCDDLTKRCESNKTVNIDELRIIDNTNIKKTYTDTDKFRPYTHIAKMLNTAEEDTDAAKPQTNNAQNYDLYEYEKYLMAKYKEQTENKTENRKDGFNFSSIF